MIPGLCLAVVFIFPFVSQCSHLLRMDTHWQLRSHLHTFSMSRSALYISFVGAGYHLGTGSHHLRALLLVIELIFQKTRHDIKIKFYYVIVWVGVSLRFFFFFTFGILLFPTKV